MQNKIIEYRFLIAGLTKGFVGRDWVRNAVDEFLRAPDARNFLLLGEPGAGKSAFMAQLVRERGYAHHFIGKGSRPDLSSSFEWRSPARFAESVGYQLVQDYGGWIMNWEDWGIHVSQTVKQLDGLLIGAKVNKFKAMPRPTDRPILTIQQELERFGEAAQLIGVYINKMEMNVEEVVHQLLVVPLKAVAERWPENQVVVVVDGLDEAQDYSHPEQNIVALLPDAGLPPNIHFLLSSSPGKHLTNEFLSHAHTFWLTEDAKGKLNPEALDDARDFVITLTTEPSVRALLDGHRPLLVPEVLARHVADASGGNFLYLHHYAEGLQAGDQTLLEVDNLPKGLSGIYGDFLDKIKGKESNSNWVKFYKPVLGTLAIAGSEWLTLQQVADFSHVDGELVATILGGLTQFLDPPGQGRDRRYRIYHPSFAVYLVSEDNADYIDPARAHERIVSYYRKRCDGDWQKLMQEEYFSRHIAKHLHGAGDHQSLYNLINPSWMTAKLSATLSHRAFVQDLSFAIEAARAEVPPNLPQLVRNCLIDATLSSLTSNVLPEALGLLAQFGQSEKALGIAALIQDAQRQSEAYCQIAKALQVKNATDETREAIGLALNAVQRVPASASMVRLLEETSVLAMQLGDQRWANQLADQAKAVVSDIADEKLKTMALSQLAHLLVRLGDVDGARRTIEPVLVEVKAWKLFMLENSIYRLARTREQAQEELKRGMQSDQWASALPKAQVLIHAADIMARLGEQTHALELINGARDEIRRILSAEERAFVLAELAVLHADRGEAAYVRQVSEEVWNMLGHTPPCKDSLGLIKMNIDGNIEELPPCYGNDIVRVGLVITRLAEALVATGWKQDASWLADQTLQLIAGMQDVMRKAEAQGWAAVAMAQAGEASRVLQIVNGALDDVQQVTRRLQILRVQIAVAGVFSDVPDNPHLANLAIDSISTALALGPEHAEWRSLVIDRVLSILVSTKSDNMTRSVLQIMGAKQDKVENSFWALRALLLQNNVDQIAEAVDRTDGMIEQIPDLNSRAMRFLQLAWLLAQAKQSERAQSILDRALEAAQSIGSTPYKVQALCSVAADMAQLGITQRAVQITEQAYEQAMLLSEPDVKANALIVIAWAFATVGQFAQAEEAARAIAPLESDLFSAMFNAVGPITVNALVTVGQIMARSHEFERALSLTEKELGYWENDEARQNVLEVVVEELARDHQWQRAREVAGKIGDPDLQSQALVKIVVALAEAQEWDAARTLAQEIEIPGSRDAAHYQITSLLASSAQWESAENAAEEIAEELSKAAALAVIALALAEAGDPLRSQEIARQAVELSRMSGDTCNRATLLSRIAQVFVETGQLAEARMILSEAFDIGRRSGRDCIIDLLESSANILAKLDRGETAWRIYQAVLEVESWWRTST